MAGEPVAQDQLQSYVRRIESVEDQIKAFNDDKSEIYKEARSNGFDVKVLRKVIAARRMDAEERREQGEIFELYWDAVHGVRAHVEIIDEFPVEVPSFVAFTSSGQEYRYDADTAGHDADGVFHDDETTEPQPETAAQMQTGRNQSKASPDRAESIADGRPISVANTLGDAGFIDPIEYETATNSQPTPSVAMGEHVPPLTVLSRTHTLETATKSTAARMDVPGPLRMTPARTPQPEPQDRIGGLGNDPEVAILAAGTQAPPVDTTNVTPLRAPKPIRPNCMNREKCGASGPSECWSCTKAATQRGGAA